VSRRSRLPAAARSAKLGPTRIGRTGDGGEVNDNGGTWCTVTMTEGSGTPFGPFMLHGAIGRGATATVYLASVVATGEQVAVKVLDQGFAALPGLAERLEGESAVLAALSGPHVVGGRGTGVVDGYRYLAMEYVDGASLRAVERAAGRLDVLQALAVTEGALAGLAMAHAYGLVHGDVKPENILVDRSGASRLVDFGEVVTVGGATEGGTPAYMSPEAAYGQLLDERSDLYSMGVVLYEALAGRRPFEAATELAVLRMHVEEAPAPVIDLGPATQALLARTLAKDPADRPQSAAALHAELGEVVDAEYGSDWRRRAAVAGLVALGATAITELAAPTSAGAAAGTGGAASGGGGGMAPSVGVPAVTAKASTGGLISSHPLMVGIVAVVAAAGLAVGGFAAARAGSSSSASAPTTTAGTTTSPPNFAQFAGTWSSDFGAGSDVDAGDDMVIQATGHGTVLDQGTQTPFQLVSADGTTATGHITGPTTDPGGPSTPGLFPVGTTLTLSFTPAGSSSVVRTVKVSYGNGLSTTYCPAATDPLPSVCIN
jgi:hypothetical protein